MKVIRATVRRGTAVQMQWPAVWDGPEVDRNGMTISPRFGGYGGDIGRGADQEFALAIVSDALATAYATDPDVEILTPAEANTLLAQQRQDNRVPEINVTDEGTLRYLDIKLRQGQRLSASEERALDPSDSTPGVNTIPLTVEEMVSEPVT